MRERFISVLFILVILLAGTTVFAAQSAGIQYTIPIDYSQINEDELSKEAETLFNRFLTSQSIQEKETLLYKLLSDYSILGEINRDNPLYFTRLGIIYGKLGKDRWAKSNFFRATNLLDKYPYAFCSFGDYYFERKDYKKALKAYKRAYDDGYNNNYDMLCQLGIIYEKFGDFSSSIKYYKQALLYKDSAELRSKILSLQELLESNPLYDARGRKGNQS